MTHCTIHHDHAHVHGSGCGHTAIKHDGHTDYLHDGLSPTATISITWSTVVCITSTAIIAMTTARWKSLHNSDR